MITSKHIKYALLNYFRFNRQFVVGTEVNNADVMAYSDKKTIEVEIKISVGDLNKDKKKRKHYYLKNLLNDIYFTKRCPNLFYFCVLPEMEQQARKLIYELNLNYGLIIYYHDRCISDKIKIIKRAKNLHDYYSLSIKDSIIKRINYELINF